MSDFNLYFQLGIEHILSWDAMDHLLFVAALTLSYQWNDWKKVAIMVTAFTIGHSLTLLLGSLGMVNLPSEWIEFFIPLTIAATALVNIVRKGKKPKASVSVIYILALFFGMIHGLAYANLLLDLEGSERLISHLLAFNLGIEAAQLLVVAIVLSISFIFVKWLRFPPHWWLTGLSIIILGFSIKMAIERIPNKPTTQTSIST